LGKGKGEGRATLLSQTRRHRPRAVLPRLLRPSAFSLQPVSFTPFPPFPLFPPFALFSPAASGRLFALDPSAAVVYTFPCEIEGIRRIPAPRPREGGFCGNS